ncbi:hypothetical protein [Klebsiella pneumoniae]|nr:hypothetical protein [Klebsiella pneumoniae]
MRWSSKSDYPNKRIPLAAFMKWPLAKRQDFIDREMSGCPDFIKTSLLRH